MQLGTTEDLWREDCAPRRVLELFATKWTSMILHVLHARHQGVARTGVLLRSVPGISKKMLTQTLREMEASGLITRHVYGTIPPAVEYRLTALGHRCVEPVELLYAWGRHNADALDLLGRRVVPRPPATIPHRREAVARPPATIPCRLSLFFILHSPLPGPLSPISP